MKQCPNGHFFDETRFRDCPYCPQSSAVPEGASRPIGPTVAVQAIGKTVAVSPAAATPECGKTVALIQKKLGFDPTVAFLICEKGPHRGQDFRLRAGRSFIGRQSGMDVALTEDPEVSRENHALVTYDPKTNRFLLSPGQGRGITYLNGEPIESAVSLTSFDRIEVGESTLIFLPLCGEKFRWDETEDGRVQA